MKSNLTIDPEAFFDDDKLSSASIHSRFFLFGLWSLCDKENHVEYNLKRLRANIFKYDFEVSIPIDQFVRELESVGYLKVLESDNGVRILEVAPPVPGKTNGQGCNGQALCLKPESMPLDLGLKIQDQVQAPLVQPVQVEILESIPKIEAVQAPPEVYLKVQEEGDQGAARLDPEAVTPSPPENDPPVSSAPVKKRAGRPKKIKTEEVQEEAPKRRRSKKIPPEVAEKVQAAIEEEALALGPKIEPVINQIYEEEISDKQLISSIVTSYMRICPTLPKVQKISERIETTLKRHFLTDPDRRTLTWWVNYFENVQNSDWLMGRKGDWAANFKWLIGPENLDKVINGAYQNRMPFARTVSSLTEQNKANAKEALRILEERGEYSFDDEEVQDIGESDSLPDEEPAPDVQEEAPAPEVQGETPVQVETPEEEEPEEVQDEEGDEPEEDLEEDLEEAQDEEDDQGDEAPKEDSWPFEYPETYEFPEGYEIQETYDDTDGYEVQDEDEDEDDEPEEDEEDEEGDEDDEPDEDEEEDEEEDEDEDEPEEDEDEEEEDEENEDDFIYGKDLSLAEYEEGDEETDFDDLSDIFDNYKDRNNGGDDDEEDE
jgi:hypothetical protein